MKARRKVGAEPIGVTAGVPDPEGLEAVRLILRLRRERVSFRKIACELVQSGHQTKRGGRWHASTVRAIWQGRSRYVGIVAEAYDHPRVLIRGRDY